MERHRGLYIKSGKEEKTSKIVRYSTNVMVDQRSNQRIVTQKFEERIKAKC
ncbi:MAG TPA: hypothetical protein VLD38_07090 [Nitrosopumilaceae archaeon]|nr:hypothetical protein [Nitrosopumilaceae archaeon]